MVKITRRARRTFPRCVSRICVFRICVSRICVSRRSAAVLLATLVVVLATLTPHGRGVAGAAHWSCLACGDNGGADAVGNVLLFVPWGAALRARGVAAWRVVLAGACLSAGVELAQAVGIPGRDPALADVLANTLGTALGALAGARWRTLARPSPRTAAWLATGAAAGWLVVSALSAWLLGRDAAPAPRLPQRSALPTVPGMGWYHGRVTRVTIDGRSLPPPGSGPAIVDAAVGRDVAVAFETAGGDDRAAFVPALFVHGARGDGQLVAGQQRADAAVRVRLRAARWHLRVPWIVLPGALAGVREGDRTRRTRWAASARGDTVRLTLTTGDQTATTAVRLTPTVAWALLIPYARVWGPERAPLTALWLAAFLAPLGYWLRCWANDSPGRTWLGMAMAGATAALGLAVVPHLLGASVADGGAWLWATSAVAAAYAVAGRARAAAPLPRAGGPDSFRACPPSCPPPTPPSASSACSSSPPASASPRSPR